MVVGHSEFYKKKIHIANADFSIESIENYFQKTCIRVIDDMTNGLIICLAVELFFLKSDNWAFGAWYNILNVLDGS